MGEREMLAKGKKKKWTRKPKDQSFRDNESSVFCLPCLHSLTAPNKVVLKTESPFLVSHPSQISHKWLKWERVNISPHSVPHPEFSINANNFPWFCSTLSGAYDIYSLAPSIGSQGLFLTAESILIYSEGW